MATATNNTTNTTLKTTKATKRPLCRSRKGVSLIWATASMLGLCAVASLAVDLGRVQLAKNQLRCATDAAALAAGEYVLSDIPTAKSVAVATAASNFADGKKVQIATADVTPVYWNEKTHKVESLPAGKTYNAVRVVAARTAANGNPIDLPFAKMIGATTCDIHAESIAFTKPNRVAIIGLDFVTMGGNATNSYDSSSGNGNIGSQNYTAEGSVASNGNITLSGSSLICGDAHPGVGKMVIGATRVTGSTTPLTKPLVYPAADVTDVINNNDNYSIPATALSSGAIKLGSQKNVVIPGGTYYVKGLDLAAGAELNFSGPATLYVAGPINMGGHTVTNRNLPGNLKIVAVGSNRINISANTDLFADVYAPEAPITLSGNGDIFGAIVGKSVSMTGTSAVHYDKVLKGGVSLVK